MSSICAYNIGTKFNEDGSVRFFPGNTIISKVDQKAPVFEEFKAVRRILAEKPIARCVTMLPDSSIHMTVIEGVCNQWRSPGAWTRKLPLDCRLSEVDDLFEAQFKTVKPLGQVRMKMVKPVKGSGIMIRLEPFSQSDALELKRYRDDVSEALGVRFPNHDDYKFHISVCYFTKEATEEELASLADFEREAKSYIESKQIVFAVQQPQLTYFDNMFCFHDFKIPRSGL